MCFFVYDWVGVKFLYFIFLLTILSVASERRDQILNLKEY